MKYKLIFFFILILILILLATIFGIKALKQNTVIESSRTENETGEQLEYIRNLQAESDEILTGNPEVQDLLNGKTHVRTYEIIHNESLVEDIYIVGFHPEKLKYSKGLKMVDGVVYRFYIDMNSKKVSIKEDKTHEDSPNFDPDSGLLVMNDYIHKEGDGISLDSSMSVNSWPGSWLSLSQSWLYQLKIKGRETINFTSDSDRKHEMKYQLKIKKAVDTENFYLSYVANGKNADVLSGNESIPSKYWKDERKRENDILTISSPQKSNHSIDYFYREQIIADSNQTIAFDINMRVDGFRENVEPEELHGWRIIIDTPLNVENLSEVEMTEFGIWAATDFGNYYPISTTIVKKGEWLGNNSRHNLLISSL
jgi:hypothetical protein